MKVTKSLVSAAALCLAAASAQAQPVAAPDALVKSVTLEAARSGGNVAAPAVRPRVATQSR